MEVRAEGKEVDDVAVILAGGRQSQSNVSNVIEIASLFVWGLVYPGPRPVRVKDRSESTNTHRHTQFITPRPPTSKFSSVDIREPAMQSTTPSFHH